MKDSEKNNINLFGFIPELKQLIQSETIFGDPYKINEVTLIPVHSVKIGFGYGNREKQNNENKLAGGGGIHLSPVAFIVIKDNIISIQNINTTSVENIIEKVPNLLEKTINLFQEKFQKTKA